MKAKPLQKNIPSGWKQVVLGDLASVTTGKRDANHGSPDGQYPFFTCAQKISRIDNFAFDTEAVLIAGNGDFNVKYYKGKFDAYQRTYILSDFKNTIGSFVYQKAKQALNEIIKNNQGSSVKFIKMSDLTDYPFLLPSIKEQQKIAEILETIDREIEKTDQILVATEKLNRGLMQQLFSRGIGHTKFKKTKIGEIPIAWDLKKLQYVCNFTTGRLNSNKAVEDGQYPFFTCAQETYQIDTYSFDQKAILLAGNNAAGKYSVKYFEGKFDAYQRTYVISVKDEKILDYYFLKEFLNTQLNELRNYSVGTNTQFLTIKLLNNLLMPLPDIDEQKKITDILSSVNAKIFTNQKLKSKLALLKKGLMQDLLSGTKRVKV